MQPGSRCVVMAVVIVVQLSHQKGTLANRKAMTVVWRWLNLQIYGAENRKSADHAARLDANTPIFFLTRSSLYFIRCSPYDELAR